MSLIVDFSNNSEFFPVNRTKYNQQLHPPVHLKLKIKCNTEPLNNVPLCGAVIASVYLLLV